MTTLIPKVDLKDGGATPTGAINRPINEKLYEVISVKDFGALGDGTTNDRDAIQAAFDYAATLGGASVYFPPATVKYKCNSTITITSDVFGVDFGGNIVDFSALTSGNAINVISSNADGNLRNTRNHTHPIMNGAFYAQDVALPVTAINIRLDDALSIDSGQIFANLGFVNFATDVYFGEGSFCTEFHHCNFTGIFGTGPVAGYSIVAPSTTTEPNQGERQIFYSCMWNNRDKVLSHLNGNGNMFFHGCSFDYSINNIMDIQAGAVFLSQCHIEQNTDNDYFFKVSSTNALLNVTDSDIILQSSKSAYAIFYSDAACTTGGVVVDNIRFGGGFSASKLVDGTGRTNLRNVMASIIYGMPTISAYQNYISYPDFENANYTSDWTLANGAIRSNTQSRGGTYSLSFPASVGVSPSASSNIPCKPGQSLGGELFYKTYDLTGSGGTFYITYNYLDKGGNSIVSGALLTLTTSSTSVWTRLSLGPQVITPAGTHSVTISILLFGVTSGTPTAYVDDVIINVI